MNLPVHYLRTIKYYLEGKWKAAHLSKELIMNSRGKIAVVYHGIDMRNDTSVNTKFSGVKNFEQEIKLLKQYTNIISLDDYVANRINSERLNVAVTFDDGFMNQFVLARPILERYDVPAAFFVTTLWHSGKNILWPDLIDHATRFAPNSILIRGEEFKKRYSGNFFHTSGVSIHEYVRNQDGAFLNELYTMLMPYAKFMENKKMDIYWKLMPGPSLYSLSRNPLFTIGSHTMTHLQLPSITDHEANRELRISKEILENIIQKEVKYFAAPFGSADLNTIEMAQKAGYKYQFVSSVDSTFAENHDHVFNRHGVNPYVSPTNQILFILNKGY